MPAKSPSSKGRKPTEVSPGFALFKEEQQEKIKGSPGKKRKNLTLKDAKTLWEELNENEKSDFEKRAGIQQEQGQKVASEESGTETIPHEEEKPKDEVPGEVPLVTSNPQVQQTVEEQEKENLPPQPSAQASSSSSSGAATAGKVDQPTDSTAPKISTNEQEESGEPPRKGRKVDKVDTEFGPPSIGKSSTRRGSNVPIQTA